MKKLERRSYEVRAVESLRRDLRKHKRVLAVGPTGCGKTVIASMLIKSEAKWRVLFVAHRYEIIDQAHAQLAAHGLKAGVVMAQDEQLNGTDRVLPSARVQVASVQTASRRGVAGRFDLIVFDEAHRTMADSYQRVAEAHPKAMVLGLTATPWRMDGRGLGDFYGHLYEIAKPSELYADGYLAKPRVFVAPMEVLLELSARMKGAATHGGDYTPGALAKIVDSGVLVGRVVDEAMRLAPKVPKVVFAGSVKHSQEIATRFRRKGVTAAHIDGSTDAEERRAVLAALRSGSVEVVSNVDVLSEGWDLPALGAVILARPTRSKARLLQMTGRVQRPYRGRVPLILDHGNSCVALQVRPGEDQDLSLEGSQHALEDEHGDPVIKGCVACLVAIPGGCSECPACGAVQPKTPRQEREERDAKLEEMAQMRMEDIRARVKAFAASRKDVPPGWVERVVAEMVS